MLLSPVWLASTSASQLSPTFEGLTPGAWIVYNVRAVEDVALPCCRYWTYGRSPVRICRLDTNDAGMHITGDRSTVTIDERLQVFVRRGPKGVDRVRAFGESCPVDTGPRDPGRLAEDGLRGGSQVTHWTTVSVAESVAFLTQSLRRSPTRKKAREVQAALAHHHGEDATRALLQLAGRDGPARRDAFFWLGLLRGRAGLAAIQRALEAEPSGALRKHLVFCLSQSPLPEGADALLQIARAHADHGLRGEALFWLAQGEALATESLAFEVVDDPKAGRQLKNKAVFALSQLPSDRAIDALIKLVRSKRPRSVRKQALFWLAHRDDDRVYAEFEAIFSQAPR